MLYTALNKPRISINPLVDYIFASDRKKESIIKSQKNPSKSIIARYRTVRAAFSRYFKDGYDPHTLIDTISRLQNKKNETAWQINDAKNSIEALRHFLKIEFPFNNLKCKFNRPSSDSKAYELEGVDIVVSPDLLLEWDDNGRKCMGAIKFNIKKQAVTLEKGRLAASVIYDFLNDKYSDDFTIDSKYCIYIDVMSERIFKPGMIEECMDQTKVACIEINNRWAKAS